MGKKRPKTVTYSAQTTEPGVAGAVMLLTAVIVDAYGAIGAPPVPDALDAARMALATIDLRGVVTETLYALAVLAIREVSEHGDREVTDWVSALCDQYGPPDARG